MKFTIHLAEIRKAIVPIVAMLGQAVALGLVPSGRYLDIATGVLWVAAAYGVYRIPNADKPAKVPPALKAADVPAPVPPAQPKS